MRCLVLAVCGAMFAPNLSAQQFVVANRASGDISVFDRNGTVDRTVPLPAATHPPEPMYVVAVGDEVVVGDRANDRVVRFDKSDYTVNGTVAVGNGVFHMWSNGRQLWVNNDVDNTTSVIDTATWSVIQTVPTPADLVSQGYKPHDVFVTRHEAFVSLLGGSGANDYVVQFSTRTYLETNRVEVGQDPHLWYDQWSHKLFVAAQNGNSVEVFDRGLNLRQTVSVPGAHGIYLPPWSRTLLVTNLTGGGTDGLYPARVGWRGRLRLRDPVDTPSPVPHNIAASRFGWRIFVTHSGATSTKVSIYRLAGWWTRRLELVGEVDAGLNPFGLAVVY